MSSPNTEAPSDSFTATTGTLTVTGGEFKYGARDYVFYQGSSASSGQNFDLTNSEDKVNFSPFEIATDEDTGEKYQQTLNFAGTESKEGLNGYTFRWTF